MRVLPSFCLSFTVGLKNGQSNPLAAKSRLGAVAGCIAISCFSKREFGGKKFQ
jgi:hypothetical protein